MNKSVFDEKSSFKKLGLSFSSNWTGALILPPLPKLFIFFPQSCCYLYKSTDESLGHRRSVSGLSFFRGCYSGRCSSELAELVPLPYFVGRSICYSDRLHDFFVTILTFYNDAYVNSVFPRTVRLWVSLPAECFPLTRDLNSFKSRANIAFIFRFFLFAFNLFLPFFL